MTAVARGWGPFALVHPGSKRLRAGGSYAAALSAGMSCLPRPPHPLASASAAFARIPFAARAFGSLRRIRLRPRARPLKCAENGDIETPGHVAFDKLHFIL